MAENAIVADGGGSADGNVGRNSFLQEGWLPPDPPTGHGEHDYVFQLFALSVAGDAVDADVEWREVVARIDQRHIGEGLAPVLEPTMPIWPMLLTPEQDVSASTTAESGAISPTDG